MNAGVRTSKTRFITQTTKLSSARYAPRCLCSRARVELERGFHLRASVEAATSVHSSHTSIIIKEKKLVAPSGVRARNALSLHGALISASAVVMFRSIGNVIEHLCVARCFMPQGHYNLDSGPYESSPRARRRLINV